MNAKEITKAKKLLMDRVGRFNTAGKDTSQFLTAYWSYGGQDVFESLGQVKRWLQNRACKKRGNLEWLRVGQNVTVLDSETCPGLKGLPCRVLSVDNPYVVIEYDSCLGNVAKISIDLRRESLKAITNEYVAAYQPSETRG